MVCLDTGFVIAYLRNDSAVRAKLEEIDRRDEPLYTTSINTFEIYKGAHNANNPLKEITRVDNLLDAFYMLNMDKELARVAGVIRNKYYLLAKLNFYCIHRNFR